MTLSHAHRLKLYGNVDTGPLCPDKVYFRLGQLSWLDHVCFGQTKLDRLRHVVISIRSLTGGVLSAVALRLSGVGAVPASAALCACRRRPRWKGPNADRSTFSSREEIRRGARIWAPARLS